MNICHFFFYYNASHIIDNLYVRFGFVVLLQHILPQRMRMRLFTNARCEPLRIMVWRHWWQFQVSQSNLAGKPCLGVWRMKVSYFLCVKKYRAINHLLKLELYIV